MEAIKLILTQIGVDIASDQIQELLGKILNGVSFVEVLETAGLSTEDIHEALVREGLDPADLSDDQIDSLVEVLVEMSA